MDDNQKIVFNKKVSRKKLIHTLSQYEPTTVVMEACYTNTKFTRIQDKKVQALKAKVKWITRCNTGNNLLGVIKELNPVLRGFVNYFRIANCQRVLKELMRTLRSTRRVVQAPRRGEPAKLANQSLP